MENKIDHTIDVIEWAIERLAQETNTQKAREILNGELTRFKLEVSNADRASMAAERTFTKRKSALVYKNEGGEDVPFHLWMDSAEKQTSSARWGNRFSYYFPPTDKP